MKNLSNIKKGDSVIVAIEKGSNAGRYINMSLENISEWTYKGVVKGVTKKYITVEWEKYKNGGTEENKFEIENSYRKKVGFGTSDHELYSSLDEIFYEVECERLYREIKGNFGGWSNNFLYTKDQLERVFDILNEKI